MNTQKEQKKQSLPTGNIPWHQFLEQMMQELLIPVGITVESEISVMSLPPKADLVFLSPEQEKWSVEQKKRLPDGVRECRCKRIIMEFKFGKWDKEGGFIQVMAYDHFYGRNQKLEKGSLQSVLFSSNSISKKTLERFHFVSTPVPGVYTSQLPGYSRIKLVVLNELKDTSYNALVKCFCSQKKERDKAFRRLKKEEDLSSELSILISWLQKAWSLKTMEKIMRSEEFKEFCQKELPILARDLEKEVLAGLTLEKRLEGLPVKKRLEGLPMKKILEGIPLKNILKEVPLEQRLEGLEDDQIEAYLAGKKKKTSPKKAGKKK